MRVRARLAVDRLVLGLLDMRLVVVLRTGHRRAAGVLRGRSHLRWQVRVGSLSRRQKLLLVARVVRGKARLVLERVGSGMMIRLMKDLLVLRGVEASRLVQVLGRRLTADRRELIELVRARKVRRVLSSQLSKGLRRVLHWRVPRHLLSQGLRCSIQG